MAFNEIFKKLLDAYSYQGWWPITDYEGKTRQKQVQLKAIIRKITLFQETHPNSLK